MRLGNHYATTLRKFRKKLGLSQEEFAHEIHVTVSTVNRWENGHSGPSKLACGAIEDFGKRRGESFFDFLQRENVPLPQHIRDQLAIRPM